VLGILYRTMKPLLEDFNPEMTSVYDDCLKGIPHDQYLQRATDIKNQYGKIKPYVNIFQITDLRYRDEKSHDRT
jgi:hypothetical protein